MQPFRRIGAPFGHDNGCTFGPFNSAAEGRSRERLPLFGRYLNRRGTVWYVAPSKHLNPFGQTTNPHLIIYCEYSREICMVFLIFVNYCPSFRVGAVGDA